MHLPRPHWRDPRARLARLIARPKLVAPLLLLALLAPLGVLVHGLSGTGPGGSTPSAELAASTVVPSSYRALPVGAGIPSGTRTWAGRSYAYSTWTSAWVTPAHSFTQLVPSWNAATPAGAWIQVLVEARSSTGATSTAKDLGRWSTGDQILKRSSAGVQADAVARVATDTLIAGTRPLTAYRFIVRLMRTPGHGAPVVHTIGAVTSTPPAAVPTTSAPLQRKAVSLAVPSYSQMIHRGQAPQYGGGGEAWCSPTSLSMVLGYYRRLPAASTYAWVPGSYADRWVDQIARMTYDYAYRGTGNWPFNTGYAATRGTGAFVTRLASLRMAERFIRAGIPVITSIRFGSGQLSGAPISATNGHLVVLVGFTAAGNPIVNDPAAPSDRTVRRVYDRAQFERAWLGGSDGMAYIVHDAAHPLPKRPAGVQNW
ncbi:MAG TPA: peptidase C39 family protein [Marmoricola sp.]|nr:peptidase C39 family protein [Marmoricola sp.]